MSSDRPSVPSPGTWADLIPVSAPSLRADVSNTIDLLTGPPAFFGGQNVTLPSVTNNSFQALVIDAEYIDGWGGHRINANASQYYSPLQGYYLCESGVAFPSASAGTCSAGVQYQSAGGSLTFAGGQREFLSPSKGTMVTSAKLVAQTNIIGWGSGDFTGLCAFQNSGGPLPLPDFVSQFSYYSTRWVSSHFGSEPLSVPANAAFPSPPALLTAAFMNANVRDAVSFLSFPPVMEAQYNAGTATIATAATFPVNGPTLTMDTVNADNYGAYSGATWTAPVSGVYYCYSQIALSCPASAVSLAGGIIVTSVNYNGGARFTVWGGAQLAAPSQVNCAIVRRRMRFTAGDTVSNTGYYRDTGAATATILGPGQWITRLIVVWESA